jgi:hypothetical protein
MGRPRPEGVHISAEGIPNPGSNGQENLGGAEQQVSKFGDSEYPQDNLGVPKDLGEATQAGLIASSCFPLPSTIG